MIGLSVSGCGRGWHCISHRLATTARGLDYSADLLTASCRLVTVNEGESFRRLSLIVDRIQLLFNDHLMFQHLDRVLDRVLGQG